jgi:hypothetical protein
VIFVVQDKREGATQYHPPMKRLLAVAIVCTAGLLHAQAPAGTPFRIEKLDPALDAIVDASASLDMLGDRFALTEGPV